MRGSADRRLRNALAVLSPPPAHREKWAEDVHSTLRCLDVSTNDLNEMEFERNPPALARYIKALRELRASYTALGPSMKRFLKGPQGALGVEYEICEALIMLEMCRRRPGQPANKRAKNAVDGARLVLEMCGLELTTERRGKWHLLSQIFSRTNRDLRHHLITSLAKHEAKMREATHRLDAEQEFDEILKGLPRRRKNK